MIYRPLVDALYQWALCGTGFGVTCLWLTGFFALCFFTACFFATGFFTLFFCTCCTGLLTCGAGLAGATGAAMLTVATLVAAVNKRAAIHLFILFSFAKQAHRSVCGFSWLKTSYKNKLSSGWGKCQIGLMWLGGVVCRELQPEKQQMGGLNNF